MLNLNKKKWNFFLYIHIRKKKSSVFNLTRNLKLETFDHGTFLYKFHELLLITLQWGSTYFNKINTVHYQQKHTARIILKK